MDDWVYLQGVIGGLVDFGRIVDFRGFVNFGAQGEFGGLVDFVNGVGVVFVTS